jgi:MFS family permease
VEAGRWDTPAIRRQITSVREVTQAAPGTERAVLQRRTMQTLVLAQILGGAAVACSVAVGSLIARDLFGSASLAGLATATLTTGAALAALPLATHVARHGRRPGLWKGYSVAAAGALLAVLAYAAELWPPFVLGLLLLGVGQAANLQTRFAAADLAPATGRARAIGTVVWATTIGSVLGPNLLGPTSAAAEAAGLPEFSGMLLVAMAFAAAAAVTVAVRLRPDPLVVAGGTTAHGAARPRISHGWAVVRAHRLAGLALTATVTAHAVMVGVMSMTPIHLDDGGQSRAFIGFVISVHIAGMYAFSPVAGWLSDRIGALPTVAIGSGVLVLATQSAGHTSGSEQGMMLSALFLLGLGWSLCLVAGSALLTSAVPEHERVGVQGLNDLLMSSAGATAGITAGILTGALGYQHLSQVAMAAAATTTVILAVAAWNGRRPAPAPAP